MEINAKMSKEFCFSARRPVLILEAPIMTVADDIYKYFFIVFQRKLDLMFQVNPLLDSHEKLSLIFFER